MKKTVLEIFNSHVTTKVESYEHPGCHVVTNKLMNEIVDDIVAHLINGELRSDDLHIRIDYTKPTLKKGGNTKLKGCVYIASHPLIDCFLDGLTRERPSCSGVNAWCYVFTDFYYKSFGKQLSMIGNSVMYILEPERAEQEIIQWIDTHFDSFIPDRNGHVPVRIDEAGDLTYCLNMWLNIAKKYENTNLMFYGYTKQFRLVNTVPYNINTTFRDLRILGSDSTKDDPNPITQLREHYGSFAINFKDPNKTPDRVKELVNGPNRNKSACPGVHMGCFACTKCPQPEENSDLWCEEH